MLEIGTLVHFCTPGPHKPGEGFIKELSDAFVDLSEDAAWRIFAGDRLWMVGNKISGNNELAGTVVLVRITKRLSGGYEYEWQCGPYSGELRGQTRVQSDLCKANENNLEHLREKYPDRFSSSLF